MSSPFKVPYLFQFQNGTIKSGKFQLLNYILFYAFQFQNGTIKSQSVMRHTHPIEGFNSKMVRLKGENTGL